MLGMWGVGGHLVSMEACIQQPGALSIRCCALCSWCAHAACRAVAAAAPNHEIPMRLRTWTRVLLLLPLLVLCSLTVLWNTAFCSGLCRQGQLGARLPLVLVAAVALLATADLFAACMAAAAVEYCRVEN